MAKLNDSTLFRKGESVNLKQHKSLRRQKFKRQSGTALITVVLIAAFVIILVMESVKVIQYQKQLSSNLIHRDQAISYLLGMEALAKIWLKKSFEKSKDKTTNLNQPWAQDGLSFPLDGGGMTASVKDMQSCFNLNSIARVAPPSGSGGSFSNTGFAKATPGQDIFEELISQLNETSGVSAKALAMATRDWLDADINPAGTDGAEDDYYQGMEQPYRTANSPIAHTSELRAMKDFNPKIYSLLLPYVCILPDANVFQINLNTVLQDQAVLLYAVFISNSNNSGITLSDITQALSNRPESGFETVEEFFNEFGSKRAQLKDTKSFFSVKSDYFQVRAKIELGKSRMLMKTLFIKDDKNNFKVVSRYFGKD